MIKLFINYTMNNLFFNSKDRLFFYPPEELKKENLLKILANGFNLSTTDDNGNTILHVHYINHDVLLIAIEKGFDINLTNKNGKTILHNVPFDDSDKEMLQLAINNGFDINKCDKFNNTIFHTGYRPNALKWALENNLFDINSRNNFGNTIFHQCPYYIFDYESLEEYDTNNILFDTKNNNSNTVLHSIIHILFIENNYWRIIDFIKKALELGFNPDAIDKKGNTFFFYLWDLMDNLYPPYHIKKEIEKYLQETFSIEQLKDFIF